jgi:dTDP-4-dehydrorhamnose 3,5-epimerase
MEITTTHLEGVLVLTPSVFADERGCFHETWAAQRFAEATGLDLSFVQDNESRSAAGVVRGLHFQAPPHAQGKLVRCSKGRILDVVVDLRRSAPTFGQHVSIELTPENARQVWIPPGFAHGFAALEDDSVLNYKCTALYAPQSEGDLRWDDPDLAIDWGVSHPLLSAKDAVAKSWSEFDSPFA